MPVPPGGALDINARLIAQWLSDHMGQPFVIENRPGAGTNIGVEAVARAPADGYTLLLIPQSVTTNATLYQHLSFDFIRDIVPIAMISSLPLVMLVNSSTTRPRPFRSSSPGPRPIRARSTWPRAAPAAPPTSAASSSRR